MTTDRASITIGLSTRPGTAGPSGDAAVVHTLADQTTAAAVVDGIGHSERVSSVATLLAAVAARIAALAGLLSAGELVADPGAEAETEPDAVAVVAVTGPEAEIPDRLVLLTTVGHAEVEALVRAHESTRRPSLTP